MKFLTRLFVTRNTRLFMLIACCHLFLALLSGYLLVNDIVFYNTYSEQLTYERAMNLFENSKRLAWIGYVILPIVLGIKFLLISSVIWIGLFLTENGFQVSFKEIFGVAVASETVFILAGFIKLFWLYFLGGNYDLNDLSYYYPLSLGNFFDFEEINRIWIFPLQTLNIFQIIYISLLAFGLQLRTGISRSIAEKAVLVSYLPGLVLVISLIMFLSIDSSL